VSLAALSPAGVQIRVDLRHFRGDKEGVDVVVAVVKSSMLKLARSVRFPFCQALFIGRLSSFRRASLFRWLHLPSVRFIAAVRVHVTSLGNDVSRVESTDEHREDVSCTYAIRSVQN
jgi:hypothetical protein